MHHVTPALGMRARGEELRVWATDSADSVGGRRYRIRNGAWQASKKQSGDGSPPLRHVASGSSKDAYDESHVWAEMEERGIERGWAGRGERRRAWMRRMVRQGIANGIGMNMTCNRRHTYTHTHTAHDRTQETPWQKPFGRGPFGCVTRWNTRALGGTVENRLVNSRARS